MSKALEDDLQKNKSFGIRNLQSNIRGGSSYSTSAHVSFMSPPVQNSHTSTSSTLSYLSLDALQSSRCKTYKEEDPTSSSISRSTPSLSSRSAEIPSYSSRMKELITSSVLYPSSRRSTTSVQDKTKNIGMEDIFRENKSAKESSLVNDDVMKLWEETEAENRRLLEETRVVRSELKNTKHQIDAMSWKASSISAVSDVEKREKKVVLEKLDQMEKELKLLSQSETMTDQTLSTLKSDNARLRDENKSLIRVISKLSSTSGNTSQANTYVCKHGRVHSYDRYMNSQSNRHSYNGSTAYGSRTTFNNMVPYRTFNNLGFTHSKQAYVNNQQGYYNMQPAYNYSVNNYNGY